MTTTARPRRRFLMMSALALLAAAAVAPAQSQWAPVSGQVTRAIDGDSIEVKIGDRLEIVRYAGISTPDIQHPTRGPEHYRDAARAANARLASGKPVQLVFDVQPRDRAGRLLAYVYAGSSFVNAELVGAGYAEVATYPPNVRHRETFMTRQREARQAKRGVWADSDVAQHHRFRPAGVYGNTRLKVYFHPDDGARNILLADPFVHFESPQQAAAAGYRPSMDYPVFARREQQILSGDALPTTSGAGYSPSVVPPAVSSPPTPSRVYVGSTESVPLPPAPGSTHDGPDFGPYGPRR